MFMQRSLGAMLAGWSALFLSTVETSAAPPDLDLNSLVLVQEVNCGATPPAGTFVDWPPGTSQVQTILGQSVRVLPNPAGSGSSYFAYKIGANKGLVAGNAYVLVVDYPEDQPRAMVIGNYGEASMRGLHTGKTVGDALLPPYVKNNPESLDIPLAGAYRQYVSLFHLHDRFSDLQRIRDVGVRPFVPADGFWVTVSRFAHEDDPLSQGAAVSRIRLYEAPAFEAYRLALNFPPEGLPRRHLFVREEMGDGTAGIFQSDPLQRGVLQSVKWFEYKARLMAFLGMNTFTKDLLEFGSNQGFDSGPGGGNTWYYGSAEPYLWEQVIDIVNGYGLDILPYYEYSGSRGSASLGHEKRARPLRPQSNYTEISWTEISRADLLDPDTETDAKLLLDVTLSRFRDRAQFVGAWFRPRNSHLPMSFSDTNLLQFSEEALGGYPVTRSHLLAGGALYQQYKTWWFGKRRAFAATLRDHLRLQGVHPNAMIVYTSDATEPGRSYKLPTGQPELIAEDTAAWSAAGVASVTPAQAASDRRHYKALTQPRYTYSVWEWHHADPEYELDGYAANNGVLMTMPFNREYTVRDAALMDAFRTPDGLAMVRHFSLNENTMNSSSGNDPLGYFVADFDRTGPFCMMAEALAMANADPTHIGYLASNTFNRGFPGYVRAFNRAFLALPAIPSTVLAGAATDPAVVVRQYPTDGFGTYLAVVNTARADKSVTVALPERSRVVDAATGEVLSEGATAQSFTLYPFELRALRLARRLSGGPVAIDDQATVLEGVPTTIPVLANDSGGTLTITGVGAGSHGDAQIVGGQVRYTPRPGYVGGDSFRYTVGNGSSTNEARVYVTVQSTAVAADLAAWGLRPLLLGDYSDGRSRLLDGGATGELTGTGLGFSGASDSCLWNGRSVAGNFQATVKLASVETAGGWAGLMLRQDFDPGSRMVAVARSGAGASLLHSRAGLGQAGIGSPTGLPVQTTPIWLRLTREGDLVTLSSSSNGTSFQVIGRRLLTGLPPVVRVGLVAAGGALAQPSRALFEAWDLQALPTPGENLVFQQDFESSSSSTAYVDATGTLAHRFRDISAEAQGGTWDIADGALRYTSASSGANDDAGFVCTRPLDGSPQVLRMSFDIGVSGITSHADVASLEFGNFPAVADYGSVGAYGNMFYAVGIKTGGGKFSFTINGTSLGNLPSDGARHAVVLYLNRAATAQSYTGPDGVTRTLDYRRAALWVNGNLLFDNAAPAAGFTATNFPNFRLRAPSGLPFVMTLDNIAISDVLEASTVALSNQAPTAAGDAATVSEGSSGVVDVLANDSDLDRGPNGLRVQGVSSPANGTAVIESGGVRYTPAPGFYGQDSFTYTVTDGNLASNAATVTVTVPNAASASSLGSLGLAGVVVGGGTGASRLLPSGYAEVRHAPSGAPSAQQRRLESMAVSGDFTAYARIHSLMATGSPAWGGLVASEGTAATSRLVLFAAAPDQLYATGVRSTAGQPIAVTAFTAAAAPPAAWMKLQRVGVQLHLSASPDGVAYEPIQTVTLSGLAASLNVGLFAANALLVADEFRVEPAQAAVFQQDFSASTSLSAYIKEVPPRRNLFNDVSAEIGGGVWSLFSSGGVQALQLDRNASPSLPPDNAAGFTKVAGPAAEAPEAAVFKFRIAVSGFNAPDWLGTFEIGQTAAVLDYDTNVYYEQVANTVSIRSYGTTYRFSIRNSESGNYPIDGSWRDVAYYLNYSPETVTYQAPDNSTQTLAASTCDLWVGTTRVISNPGRVPSYTGSKMSGFRFRSSTTKSGILRLDDLSLAPIGAFANQAPQAVADTAVTDEGQAVDIPVLQNDADPDAGPLPLALAGVGPASGGTTSVAASQVRYVPHPGFHGTDAFTYTLSDGAAQATGQVTVSVSSTAVAPDLTGEGLAGADIGAGSSGGSRVLAGAATWEIKGVGAGAAGTADSYHGEWKTMAGDFTMLVRIREITGGSAARVGIAAREGTAAGSRMAVMSAAPDGAVRWAARSVTNESASQATASGSWAVPHIWLLIERQGDVLRGAVSSDGAVFHEVASATLASLDGSLQVGPWMAGNDPIGRGVVSDFVVEPLALYAQNFNASAVLNDYFAPTEPTASQLHDLSAESGGGTWTVHSGALQLARSSSATPNNGAGFTRIAGPAGTAPTVVEMKFKVAVTGSLTNYSFLGTLQVGQISAVQDYNSVGALVLVANELALRATSSSSFCLRMNGTQLGSYPADGTWQAVTWVSNYSGSGVNYLGPDGNSHALASGLSDVWVGLTRVFAGTGRSSGLGSNAMGGFRFRCDTTAGMTLKLDDIVFRDLTP